MTLKAKASGLTGRMSSGCLEANREEKQSIEKGLGRKFITHIIVVLS